MVFSRIFSSVRYSLLTLNLVFLVTGIAIFSVGVSAQVAYNEYHPFLAQNFFSLPAFLIVTGVFIFAISALGFFGAMLQNYKVNMLYLAMMVLIFVFEVSACIAGYALYNSTASLLRQSLLETLPEYGASGNLVITALWDEVQRDFQCCGVNGPNDWPIYLPGVANTTAIPLSCCTVPVGTIDFFPCNVTESYQTGCAVALGDWAGSHALGMGVAGLIICLIQLGASAGAGWIATRSQFENVN